MTNSYYKISLDIHDHGSHVSLKAKRGDTGHVLCITLMDGSRPYVITKECFAVFTAKKADGSILFNECSITGNTIIYAFTPQTTSSVGKANCEIKVYGADNMLLTSAKFVLMVEDTVYHDGDEVESTNEFTALSKLFFETSSLIEKVEQKLENGEFKGEKGDRGSRGETGATGDRGPQGVSVVVAPSSGHFALEVDSATGNLYCVTEDDATTCPFVLDENGNLYYEIKED